MHAIAIKKKPSPLSERQQSALVSLLADEDPAIFEIVREELLSHGRIVADWLRPHLLSNDPVLRRRARAIVNKFGRQDADQAFLTFCLKHGEELDLELATTLLSRTVFPEANPAGYQALYDTWAEEARAKINFSDSPERILNNLNQYLFHELKLMGNYSENPEDCYLTRVVDRREGNPINLCALMLFLSRRLKLPISGIGLPGHFLCRYQSSTHEIYIDCYRQGEFWTKADCIRHLLNAHRGLQEGYLAPVSPRRMLLRMCANLHQAYMATGVREQAARLQRYLVALAK